MKRNIYRFNNIEISLEKTSNLDNLSSKDDSSLAILDGHLVDKNGIKAISYGEIIKTSTLKNTLQKF